MQTCDSCLGLSRVIDSRTGPHDTIRRRRECPLCGRRFTTYEYKAASITPAALHALTSADSLARVAAEVYEASKILNDKVDRMHMLLAELRRTDERFNDTGQEVGSELQS